MILLHYGGDVVLQLYKNIKSRRIELKMTQSELAKKLGYADKSMIAKIEKGSVDLPQSKIIAFADVLNVAPGDLMGWDKRTEQRLKLYADKFINEKKEAQLLEDYSKLNDLGKEEAQKRVSELTEIDRYTKQDHLMPVAAHNDNTDDPEQQKLMEEDLADL